MKSWNSLSKWWNNLNWDQQEGVIFFSVLVYASIACLIVLYAFGFPWLFIILMAAYCIGMCSIYFGAVKL